MKLSRECSFKTNELVDLISNVRKTNFTKGRLVSFNEGRSKFIEVDLLNHD